MSTGCQKDRKAFQLICQKKSCLECQQHVRKIERQADRQTERQTDRKSDRRTERLFSSTYGWPICIIDRVDVRKTDIKININRKV